MEILVYEHLTGGGLGGGPLPGALAREGRTMRDALAADLAAIPGIRVAVACDPRVAPPAVSHRAIVPDPARPLGAWLGEAARPVGAVWLIAPETGGLLERLTQCVAEAGARVIGCAPEAIAIAASKRATVRRLSLAGVACVPTFAAGEPLPDIEGEWVVKPDDGVACEGARVVPGREAAARVLIGSTGNGLVAQPWLAGAAMSLSLVVGSGQVAVLSINRQHVRRVRDGLNLVDLEVNLAPPAGVDFAGLGGVIAAAIPGLAGYVGVDFVLTPAGPVVLEVNPRLTSSYCGLSRALGRNVAAEILRACAFEAETADA